MFSNSDPLRDNQTALDAASPVLPSPRRSENGLDTAAGLLNSAEVTAERALRILTGELERQNFRTLRPEIEKLNQAGNHWSLTLWELRRMSSSMFEAVATVEFCEASARIFCLGDPLSIHAFSRSEKSWTFLNEVLPQIESALGLECKIKICQPPLKS